MLFWMMPDGGSDTKKDFDLFAARFKEENPGVEIKVEYITRHNLWNKLFLMRFDDSHGEMPDVIEVPHTWTPFLTSSNTIENLSALDPSLSLNPYLSPLTEHCYKAGSKDIYALPWWMDVMAMHYRADHLAQVSRDPAKDLSTWQGMLDVCAKLKESFKDDPNYYPIQNSDGRGTLSIRSTLPCIWSRGSDLFNKEEDKSCFNDEAFISAMEDYITLAQKNYMPILMERGSLGTMVSGRASLFMTRRQNVGEVNNTEIKTLPVPVSGEKQFTYLSGINLVINRRSEHKQSALEFIKWLLRKDNQLAYAVMMGVFPSVEESFDEFIFSSPQRMQTYTKIMVNAKTLSTNIVAATSTKILNEVFDRLAIEIVKGTYTRDMLVSELNKASKEADYLLNLYGGKNA